MKVYKVVPCPSRIVAKPKDNTASAFNDLAEIIRIESLGGWELVSAMPVTMVTKKRRLKTFEEVYNALVFAKEQEQESEETPEKADKTETAAASTEEPAAEDNTPAENAPAETQEKTSPETDNKKQ